MVFSGIHQDDTKHKENWVPLPLSATHVGITKNRVPLPLSVFDAGIHQDDDDQPP